MIYFISDTHFDHKGSLRWPNGAARHFSSVEEMNKTMIDNWNSVVKEGDTVYHLGDFCYKARNWLIKEIMNQLNGTIIFIKGNHDTQTLKINQQIDRFASVHERLELDYKYNRVNYHFVLDHFPLESWNLMESGSIHLHGHIHEKILSPIKNRRNVSVEVIKYTPIDIETIIIDNLINNI